MTICHTLTWWDLILAPLACYVFGVFAVAVGVLITFARGVR